MQLEFIFRIERFVKPTHAPKAKPAATCGSPQGRESCSPLQQEHHFREGSALGSADHSSLPEGEWQASVHGSGKLTHVDELMLSCPVANLGKLRAASTPLVQSGQHVRHEQQLSRSSTDGECDALA